MAFSEPQWIAILIMRGFSYTVKSYNDVCELFNATRGPEPCQERVSVPNKQPALRLKDKQK